MRRWPLLPHRALSSLASGVAGKPAATKPYFVTTPIYYVNAAPHIGHLYSSLLADCVARYRRAVGDGVLFGTGTDEHGQKVQQAAASAGLPLPQFCGRVSASFQQLHADFNVGHDDFLRTVEPRHAAVVQWLWQRLVDRGAIYMGAHEGWYCQSDESFLTDMQVVPRHVYAAAAAAAASQTTSLLAPGPLSDTADTAAIAGLSAHSAAAPGVPAPPDGAAPAMVSAESGHPVTRVSEENYMFRLSAYQAALLEWIQPPGGDEAAPAQPSVLPPSRAREVATFVRGGLNDLSVSRRADKVWWAIPVPGDPSHSIYVWVDALANYLTVAMRGGAYDTTTPRQQPQQQWGTSSPTSPLPSALPASTPPAAPAPTAANICIPRDADWRDVFPAWPADLHGVGKDILRFHAVYWPALLLAAGLPPPRRILAHGHWTVGHVKMSKSLGNVVAPATLLGEHGGDFDVDAVRYFLLRRGGLGADGDFSAEELRRAAHSECADTFGNLASRVVNAKLLPGGACPLPVAAAVPTHQLPPQPPQGTGATASGGASPPSLEGVAQLVSRLGTLRDAVSLSYAAADAPAAAEAVMDTLALANRVFTAAAPWALARPGAPAAAAAALSPVMFASLEALRVSAILLAPIMPSASATLLVRLGVAPRLTTWSSAVWGAARPADYGAVDVASGPLILFEKKMGVVGGGSAVARQAAASAAATAVPAAARTPLGRRALPVTLRM